MIAQPSAKLCINHDVFNVRIVETYVATAIYIWPAAVDTLPLVKT